VTNAIEISGLVKDFGKIRALDGINLNIAAGSIYGLLGPNGAGKTTTIRVLATLLKPSAGKVSVLGYDVVQNAAIVRQKVSLTGQYASVDEELTGTENLILMGRLLGLTWQKSRQRANELLAIFGLEEAAKQQVRTYSGGMRRRLDIAASLVTKPAILFLDEPTTGLDPRSRNQVWDLVRQIAAEHTTVLLTTQYLEEADRLANRLAVIDQGRVIAEGTSYDLKASIGGNTLLVHLIDSAQHAAASQLITNLLKDALLLQTDPSKLSVKVRDAAVAADVVRELTRAAIGVSDFSLSAPSLDDVFFTLTGREREERELVQ
jgi:ABC-2 type transport system ATP-binding protein